MANTDSFAPPPEATAEELRGLAAGARGLAREAYLRQADVAAAGGLGRFLGLYTRAGDRVPAYREARGGVVRWRLRYDVEGRYKALTLPSGRAGRTLENLGLVERLEAAPAEVRILDEQGRGVPRVVVRRTGCEYGTDAVPWRGEDHEHGGGTGG